MSNLLMPGSLRNDLLRKLRLFLDRGENLKDRPAIYSTRPELWKTDENPVILPELPPIPPHYDYKKFNILREMMDYLLKINRHIPFSVAGFEFVCEGRSEVHLVFSPDRPSTISNPGARYLAHPPGAHRQQTEGLPSTSSIFEPDHIRAIVERFSEDLKENLKNKIEFFAKKVRRWEQDIIFTDDKTLWKKNKGVIVDDTHGLPPLPRRYSLKKFNISRDVEDYLNFLAALEGNPPFYASCVQLGENGKVHSLLSQRKESVLHYLEVSHLPSESGSADVIMVPAEGDSSTLDQTVKRRKIASSSPMLERVEILAPIENIMFPRQATAEEIDAIVSRFNDDLIGNLETKIGLYVNRGEENKRSAVIFTNEQVVWRTDRNPLIITDEPFPPIPPGYDHEKFNLAEEIVIYLIESMRRSGDKPFNVSALQIGKEKGLKLHLVLSHYAEEHHALLHLDRCLPSHYLSSEVFSAPAFMVAAEYRHYSNTDSAQSFKTNVMVKLHRPSSAPGRLEQDVGPGPSTAWTRGDD